MGGLDLIKFMMVVREAVLTPFQRNVVFCAQHPINASPPAAPRKGCLDRPASRCQVSLPVAVQIGGFQPFGLRIGIARVDRVGILDEGSVAESRTKRIGDTVEDVDLLRNDVADSDVEQAVAVEVTRGDALRHAAGLRGVGRLLRHSCAVVLILDIHHGGEPVVACRHCVHVAVAIDRNHGLTGDGASGAATGIGTI
ncbi:MAG: hypothetical protein ABI837_02295 [Acidobacteriota bacterium]